MGKNKIKHLLVIRLSAMGDVAMTVPVLSALTTQHPNLQITVLTRAIYGPMFNYLANVHVYEADVNGKHKGIFGLWKLFKELKTMGIDAVADLHNVLRSSVLRRFFVINNVPFIQIDKGRTEKKALTATKNKVFKPLKTTFQRYADVFNQLGFPVQLQNARVLSKRVLPEKVQQLIRPDNLKWIGIAPFATYTGKMYPLDLMEKVIISLNNTNKYKIILFGGGDHQKKQAEQWSDLYKNCINTIDILSFEDQLALISNLDLMLSMDSGNGHLAAMFNIPTITLWGVTHPYAGFSPFNQASDNSLLSDRNKFPFIPTSIYGNKTPRGYENVMSTILPETVLSKITSLVEIK
ncbi:glycosyltransferase family 9 protein [uncultured Eudoraea sp.]|uniref:glycosyltransferase family 9 protein n=1 Tax=uncultured Eudoraea sp. TaxID=1035614 RepID=UPI0026234323|nr:glycosyltransferase family 9 protein [uncultured Eudoraea sp.]